MYMPPLIREKTALFTECYAGQSEDVTIIVCKSVGRVFHKRNILTSNRPWGIHTLIFS